jgi:hypothetical protein
MPLLKLRVTPQQAKIINHPARTKYMAIGRRWGKTACLLVYAIKVCCENPGCICLYVCQNYSNALRIKRRLKRNKGLKAIIAHDHSQFPPRFEFTNGSTLEFKSFDKPGSLPGPGYKFIGFDEACLAKKETVFEILGPTVSDTGGTLCIASNYQRGKDWFYNETKKALTLDAQKNGVMGWEYKTADGMRFQSERGKAELARLKRILPPDVYQCQYENIPKVGLNNFFTWRAGVNEKGTRPAGPEPGKWYCQGFDVGRRIDPSYSVVVECPEPIKEQNEVVNEQPAKIVYAERFPLGLDYRSQARRAIEIARFWNNAVTVGDDTGARGGAAPAKEAFWHLIEEEFWAARTRLRAFHFNQYSKFTLINFLEVEMSEGRVFCAPPEQCKMFEELVNQIKIFTFKVTNNFVRYGAPDGEHDDGVCALGMAIHGKVKGWATPDNASVMAGAIY